MTAKSLREAFALLHREGQAVASTRATSLTLAAQREIRARVRSRWLARAAVLALVGGLGAFAVGGTFDGRDRLLDAAPSQSPTLAVSAATFGLDGRPSFAAPSSALSCGDPAPASRPEENGVALTVSTTEVGATSGVATPPRGWATAVGVLSPATGRDLGVVATSGIDFLVVRDGVIVGTMLTGHLQIGWRPDAGGDLEQGVRLITNFVECPSVGAAEPPHLSAGVYSLMAIARVFSTPEAVALAQVTRGSSLASGLDPESSAIDPLATFRPGSFDCAVALAVSSLHLGCLADVTARAVVDPAAGTATVLYDAADLVDEFDATLVSAPIEVTLARDTELDRWSTSAMGSVASLASPEDFACGATGATTSTFADAMEAIGAVVDEASLAVLARDGDFSGGIMAWHAPDGSRVELLAGARVVYLNPGGVNHDIQGRPFSSSVAVDTVVAEAAVSRVTAVEADRYLGPRSSTFTIDAATVCPGFEALWEYPLAHAALAGHWRVTAPDGTATTHDAVSELGHSRYAFWTSTP